MDIVGGAVGSVVRKLGKLLLAEYKLQKGLPEQIEYLIHELESAHTALLKVGEVPPKQLDPQVQLWSHEVREASYDMEDILDSFLVSGTEVAGPAEKKEGLLKRLQKKMAKLLHKSKARHTIAGAIEDMKKWLKEVTDRRDRFSVAVALPAPAMAPHPRLAAMHKEAAQLISTKKTTAELKAMLLPTSNAHGDGDADVPGTGSSKTKIVSVVGCGGLGRTTLAKAVYDELRKQYKYRAFVSVGRKPDLIQVFSDIFFHLDRDKFEAIRKVRSLQLLVGELQKFLENKRYFIVVDDVWDITTWKLIKSALDQKNSESIVITTTRNRQVSSSEEVYELDPLSCDNSRKLFYMRLFGGEGICPANHPAEASEKILQKCGGVPLSIITMASLLVGKSREDWIDICNSPGFYRGKDNQQVDDTVWILSLSYYDLPSDLKTCLLYLSVYPEDYVIMKNCLIWKWIAEGFVEKKSGTSLFQRGEEYFNQLINRSMIQAVESEEDGVYGCRVHDMVLDFIRDLSDQENFVTISDNDEGTSRRNNVRRLSHQNRVMKQTWQDHMAMVQLRTLVACGCDIDSWVLHPSFKFLRVLALEVCRLSEEWHGLELLRNLVHLRYLGLDGLCITKLPEEIGALKLLQTLDLQGTCVEELPSSAIMLMQLVCLFGCCLKTVPDGFFEKVTSLEELHFSLPGSSLDGEPKRQFFKDLGNLSEVRVLHLDYMALDSRMQSDLLQALGNLHKLQHLELSCSSVDYAARSTREWDTVVLPRYLQHLNMKTIIFPLVPSFINLPNICRLMLVVDHMDDAGLRVLGGLPELCYLSLSLSSQLPLIASVATVPDISRMFQKLRYCSLHGLMVRFVLNEDSTSVSFSTWNGKGAIAFGSRTKKDDFNRSLALSVMPNLKELWFDVHIGDFYKDGNGSCEKLGLEYLPSLCRAKVLLHFYKDAYTDDEYNKAYNELRHIEELHPNSAKIETLLLIDDLSDNELARFTAPVYEEERSEAASVAGKEVDTKSRGDTVTPSN